MSRELGVESGPKRLSYSSSNVLLGCERRYKYKIADVPFDSDYVDDRKALRIGKGYHLALEYSKHEMPTGKQFLKAFVEENIDDFQEQGLIIAMCMKYVELHEKSGLKAIAFEIEVGDKHVIGYVDVVYVDGLGNWYFGDLKTAGKLAGDLLSRLHQDVQLNLYAFYAPEVAAALGLDIDKFLGCIYRVTTKASIKIKPGEKPMAYAKRIIDKVEAYHISIPYNPKVVKATRKRMEQLWDKHSQAYELGEYETMQNFGNCFHYFSPCPWWSRCHGHTYSDGKELLVMKSSKDMKICAPGDVRSKQDMEEDLLIAKLI